MDTVRSKVIQFFKNSSKILIIWILLFLPSYINPFHIFPYEPSKVTFFWLALIILLIVNLSRKLLERPFSIIDIDNRFGEKWKIIIRDNPFVIPLIFYGLVYVISTVVSIDWETSFWGIGDNRGTLTIILSLAFSLIVRDEVNNWEKITRIIDLLIFASIPVAIFGWFQVIGWDPLHWQPGPQWTLYIHSTFANHVFLGMYLGMVVPFTITKLLTRSTGLFDIASYLIVFFLQISILIISFARSAYIGVFIGFIVFIGLIISQEISWKYKYLLYVALLGIGIIGPILILSHFIDNINVLPKTLFLIKDLDETRILAWKKSIEFFSHRWSFGYGPDTISYVEGYLGASRSVTITLNSGNLDNTYNIILYHLTGVGIVGLAGYLFILGTFYYHGLTMITKFSEKWKKLIIIALVSSLTLNLIQTQFNPESIVTLVLFWVMIALLSSIYRLQIKDES
jgi:hypothetical protein